jgi:DNA-binding response OmpR family regulator
MRLPSVERSRFNQRSPTMSTSIPPPLAAGRIGIAVQVPAIERLLAMALRLEGFAPRVFADGEHALTELLQEQYAATIVDVHLYPVDVFLVCQHVRAATATPVILMLMRDEVPERIRAAQVGASALLFLPFEIPDLLTCVQSVLRPPETADDQRNTLNGGKAQDDTLHL